MTDKQAIALPVGALLRKGKRIFVVIARNTRRVTFATPNVQELTFVAAEGWRRTIPGVWVRELRDFHRIA